jgi:hypothetical protein
MGRFKYLSSTGRYFRRRSALAQMMRCPACGLPMDADGIGLAIAASSNDGTAHGVIAICTRCAHDNRRLPAMIQRKRMSRAADRALQRPEKFLCAVVPSIGAARLAVSLLGHPQHGREALSAIGWGEGIDHAEKTP